MSKGKILFELTGSIACFKACALISKLVQADFELEIVATANALEFVGIATLEGLTGKRVHTQTFEPGRYMSHIHLTKWADLTLVYPATANALGKFSHGIGDDLVSTLFLAHDFQDSRKSIWIAPAMNPRMFYHPATAHSIERLKSWGATMLETESGHLACGDHGEGRLIEPGLVLEKIHLHFEHGTSVDAEYFAQGATAVSSPPKSQRVLITAGGTREPIDGVRAITNTSSGKTGATIAEYIASRGHRVTLLRATDAAPCIQSIIEQKTYTSFASLQTLLKTELQTESYDSVIHLAAVADYSVKAIESGGQTFAAGQVEKIDSQNELTLKLRANPKLVEKIRTWSQNPHLKLVAFKLTNTENGLEQTQAIKKLADRGLTDWIVHNDLHAIHADSHAFTIFKTSPITDPQAIAVAHQALHLAGQLAQLLEQSVAPMPRPKERSL